MLFRMRTDLLEPVQSAPEPGLEPGTISLHIIHHFHDGVDYIIILSDMGRFHQSYDDVRVKL